MNCPCGPRRENTYYWCTESVTRQTKTKNGHNAKKNTENRLFGPNGPMGRAPGPASSAEGHVAGSDSPQLASSHELIGGRERRHTGGDPRVNARGCHAAPHDWRAPAAPARGAGDMARRGRPGPRCCTGRDTRRARGNSCVADAVPCSGPDQTSARIGPAHLTWKIFQSWPINASFLSTFSDFGIILRLLLWQSTSPLCPPPLEGVLDFFGGRGVDDFSIPAQRDIPLLVAFSVVVSSAASLS